MGTPYEKTVDGLEVQFGVNHIGNFLFTNLIMPKLLESSAPRVVSVSSMGHVWGPVRFEVNDWTSYVLSMNLNKFRYRIMASKTARLMRSGRDTVRVKLLTFFSPSSSPNATKGASSLRSLSMYVASPLSCGRFLIWLPQPGGAITGLHKHMTKEDYIKFGSHFNLDGTPNGDWHKTVEECTGVYVNGNIFFWEYASWWIDSLQIHCCGIWSIPPWKEWFIPHGGQDRQW